jgi:hypothetical protein
MPINTYLIHSYFTTRQELPHATDIPQGPLGRAVHRRPNICPADDPYYVDLAHYRSVVDKLDNVKTIATSRTKSEQYVPLPLWLLSADLLDPFHPRRYALCAYAPIR